MRLDKVARDGKSQSAALYLGAGHTEVALEDAFVITRVYASSEILYIQPHMVLVLLQGSYNHPVVFRRISYGIAKQISQHPCYFLAIDIELAYFLLWVIQTFSQADISLGSNSPCCRHRFSAVQSSSLLYLVSCVRPSPQAIGAASRCAWLFPVQTFPRHPHVGD